MQAVQEIQTSEEAKIIQEIRCSNCGCTAERHYLLTSQITRTQCPSCDYLMITCSRTGRVIEAYAPGIAARC
ncbi:MAG: replication restart DNA helicase PriA [Oculatellaceae cyanobacterium Prado106]|nr:replication restart DNA helicase PriA [Oculatellaceae cyanobacterium Prado106]